MAQGMYEDMYDREDEEFEKDRSLPKRFRTKEKKNERRSNRLEPYRRRNKYRIDYDTD